ncbi:hypothetical protein DND58_02560 [Pseudomonas syringae pv. pisi]|nr:hypothetical protein DND62_22770 [Pseudomonas syringae pv. pisi]PYD32507.1 hypothetical protein DND67_13440 [Pseudomonas syringae pv. pisi]PYD33251.1 hypothetical protein DND58_02560 [Pseudomonas syringae pv. pisi]
MGICLSWRGSKHARSQDIPTRSPGATVFSRTSSFLTLQRGSAYRDALRHGCAPRRLINSGRGAWTRWRPSINAPRRCGTVPVSARSSV